MWSYGQGDWDAGIAKWKDRIFMTFSCVYFFCCFDDLICFPVLHLVLEIKSNVNEWTLISASAFDIFKGHIFLGLLCFFFFKKKFTLAGS